MRLKLIGVLTVITLLVVAGGAVYFGLLSGLWSTSPPEHSARYYPDDAIAYTWLTMNPSMGQRRHMLGVWQRLDDMRDFRRAVDGLEGELDDEIGIDFEEDVLPWIGVDFSAAILDVDWDDGEIDVAATVAVRDRDGAADFLDLWMDYLEDEQDADFERDTINGYDVWVDEAGQQAYSMADDLLVFATTEVALEDVLDRVSGQKSRSLANDEYFIEAKEALPPRRFASVYVNYRRLSLGEESPSLLDLFGAAPSRELQFASYARDACEGRLFQWTDWSMASVAWADQGIVVNVLSPTVDGLLPDAPYVVEAADILPEESLGFLSLSFDPNMENWRSAFGKCQMVDLVPDWDDVLTEINAVLPNIAQTIGLADQMIEDEVPYLDPDSTLADVLDTGIWTVDQLIGIDVEEEIFDNLAGDIIAAVYEVDFGSPWPNNFSGDNVDAVFMLSYHPDGEETLSETVDNFVGEFESAEGLSSDTRDVGATNDARVFQLDDQQVEPGYVFHDGFLTFGMTDDSLVTTVSRLNGKGSRISDSPKYKRVVEEMPNDRHLLAYWDLNRIVSGLDPYEMDIDEDLYEVLLETFNAAALSVVTDENYTRTTFALSLFPEE